jgi:type IV pilus assembly protein PilE
MQTTKGFTLIEVMITVAIVAILASVAIPSYSTFIKQGKLSEGTTALSEVQVKMESFYQNLYNYGTGTCGVPNGTFKNFTLSCALTNSGQGYTFTATGIGAVAGTVYTINQSGTKSTNGTKACWIVSGSEC